MLKEVVRALDAGLLPQVGLLAFLVAFLLVIAFALTMPKSRRNQAKLIPLNDD